MEDSGKMIYRGMQEANSAAALAGPVINREDIIAPPESKSMAMALSIVPVVSLLAVGFATRPALSLMILGTLVVLPWGPILFGFLKSLITRRRTESNKATNEMPSMTILLPLYNEANIMQQLADMLRQIDYPSQVIDCLVLLEADDKATALAALRTNWPDVVRIVSVPHGHPRTKGRACNFGLLRSVGEIVVIFDAEDKPHPQQMREAAGKFAAADKNLACLQAPLHIVPQANKWLQLQFALEYSVLFQFKLPHLDAALACLPLGGSSNYFRRDALLRAGAWDAHNLTEDADLALRLAGYGYRIATLQRETLENAPHTAPAWFYQPTRWHSGHIQIMHAYALWTCAMAAATRMVLNGVSPCSPA